MRAGDTAPGALDSWHAQPHPISGVLDCPGEMSFRDLTEAALLAGWSTDGLHAEPAAATLAELLERRQPRPRHFCDGLLATRVCRIVASRPDGAGYASALAPRKASGPDLAYFFIGGEGRFGHIERATVALVRPAPRYLHASGQLSSFGELFRAARELTLLEPLSIRRLDGPAVQLEAWVPVRQRQPSPVRAAVQALGMKVEEYQAVPDEARFAQPQPPGPRLLASGPYRRLAPLLEAVAAEPEALAAELRYCDAHGALAVVSAELPRLERLLGELARQPEWDDLWIDGAEKRGGRAAELPALQIHPVAPAGRPEGGA